MEPTTPPKGVTRYHFNADRVVISGSVVAKDEVGGLAAVAALLAKNHVDIVASQSMKIGGTDLSEWGFFAEVKDEGFSEKDLKASLQGLPEVVSVQMRLGHDGVVIDREHFPLQFNTGEQCVALRLKDLVEMFQQLKAEYGTGGRAIIFGMGRATGESDARELLQRLGEGRVIQNLPDMIYLYTAQGWGKPELVSLEFGPLRSSVRMYDNFECAFTRAESPNCDFIRGHLAGLARAFFGLEVEVTETSCKAVGNPYCEFYSVQKE